MTNAIATAMVVASTHQKVAEWRSLFGARVS